MSIPHIKRSLCPNGTGHEGIPDGELAGYEWRAIFRWAERESLVIPSQLTHLRGVSRLCIQNKRRFAAEEWVKPEVDPPRDSRCRAGLWRLSMTAESEAPPALTETPP